MCNDENTHVMDFGKAHLQENHMEIILFCPGYCKSPLTNESQIVATWFVGAAHRRIIS